METAELLEQLVELAGTAGLQVRRIRGRAGAEGEPDAASGVCFVRGTPWVVLSATDSAEDRIAVLAGALRTHAPDFLETHYLPPAVRARLEV